MKKSIIYTVGLGGALGASLLVGGIASSNVFNGEKMPMTGEETIEIENIETPQKESVVENTQEVATIIEQEANEVPEVQANEPVVGEPQAPTASDICETSKVMMLEKFGTLDFFEAVNSLPGVKPTLERLGITDWETIRNEYYKGDVLILRPTDTRSFIHQLGPQGSIRALVLLDRDINKNC